MPNFSSVALFVQKLFRCGNFTPPRLFNVQKMPNWERVKVKKVDLYMFFLIIMQESILIHLIPCL